MQLETIFNRGKTENKVAKKLGMKRIIRYLISIGLVVLVYRSVDFPSLLNTLKQISPSTGLYLVLAYLGGQVISALKWRIFLDGAQVKRTLPQILKAYFFGMFVNTYGLGTVGGDVARAVVLRPGSGKRAATLATVVADRIHGLTTLLTIGAIAVVIIKPAVLGAYAIPLAICG